MSKVKKKPTPPEDKLKNKLDGSIEDLNEEDKIAVMKEKYRVASEAEPDFEKLEAEWGGFNITLNEAPDVVDFSDINRNIALCQTYSSRVSTIERMAVGNCSNWEKLCNDMKIYVAELESEWEIKESELLLSEDIKELKNASMQKAAIVNKLPKEHKNLRKAKMTLSRLQAKLAEAEAFLKIVRIKSKDLAAASMNINRQMKAISLEISNNPS
jgi:hypothetical protein